MNREARKRAGTQSEEDSETMGKRRERNTHTHRERERESAVERVRQTSRSECG